VRVLPCDRCGTATLAPPGKPQKPYEMGIAPGAFRTMGAPFAYKCSCGARMVLSKEAFYRLPDVP
jgi:hypothetical protein